jgi:hypothetical protein
MTNFDEKTGIHYGVIAQNSLNSEAFQEVFDRAVDLNFEEYVEGLRCEIRDFLEDKVREKHIVSLTEDVFDVLQDAILESYGGEKTSWEYSDEDYELQDCLETNVMVTKSPYYTFCRKCSPCVPNAGDLDNPMDEGVKTYCLGPEFFDDEKAPYSVYSVKTGDLIKSSL